MQRWKRLASLGTTLLLSTTLASTSAVALFYPQARLEQLSLQTANISLLISPDPQGAGGSFVRNTSLNLLQSLRANGQEHSTQFWVKNASHQGVNFRLRLKLLPGDQDWALLRLEGFFHVLGAGQEGSKLLLSGT